MLPEHARDIVDEILTLADSAQNAIYAYPDNEEVPSEISGELSLVLVRMQGLDRVLNGEVDVG